MNAAFAIPAILLCLLLCGCHRPATHSHDASTTALHDAHDNDAADRTHIAADIAREAGIRVTAVGAGTIADEHVVQGLLTPVDGRMATVSARFPGVVRELHARAGDTVRSGQLLAVIESNLSLSTYQVTAPLGGTVLARHATLGGMTNEAAPLYEIADLSTLWVDLHIFASDAGHFRVGMPVEIAQLAGAARTRTRIDRILPAVATASQSTIARATLSNPDGLWQPGAAVQARITVDEQHAALVVPLTALQTFEGRETVFVQQGEDYQARAVQTGQRDARQAEILDGVQPGELVVVEQSYLIKADLEKSGAAHEH